MTKAYELIEKGWCQNSYVRDEDGVSTGQQDSNAVRWCAEGAIYAVHGYYTEKSKEEIIKLAAVVRKRWPERYTSASADNVVLCWNDDAVDKAEIVELMKEADV